MIGGSTYVTCNITSNLLAGFYVVPSNILEGLVHFLTSSIGRKSAFIIVVTCSSKYKTEVSVVFLHGHSPRCRY